MGLSEGPNKSFHIVAVVGSLRKASYNRALMMEAIAAAPEGVTIEVFDQLSDMPLFNQDIEDIETPDSALAFKEVIRKADGLLVVTPEYNSGLPAALKNAIDWASRGTPSVFKNLAVGIMGTSPGALGTSKVQQQLKQSLSGLGAYPLAAPDFVLPLYKSKFDDEMKLNDSKTVTRITNYLDRLRELGLCLNAIRPQS
ncbi:NADPH-dependent FMN reductase [uncultured Kiloniella sp.]|uniref:NADPH-dependent FMN reductase n=1 Tax=Kiloniella sp. TaxID=1938587 RepID=UPI0026336ED7|nr:NADPH-dependent FMN reductase [uncultured Kiloniella sp.]